jgi:hypothetical protein
MRRLQTFLLNAFLLLIPLLAGAWLLAVQPAHAQYPHRNSDRSWHGLSPNDMQGAGGGGGNGGPIQNNNGTTGNTGTGSTGGNNTGYPGGNTGSNTGYPGGNTGYPGGSTGSNTGNNTGSNTGYPGGTGGSNTGSNTGYPGGNTGSNTGSNTGYPGGTTGGSSTGGSGTGYPGGNTGGSGTGGSGTGYPGGGNTGGSGTGGTGTGGSGTGGTGTGGTGTGGTITPGHWDTCYSSQGTTSWHYLDSNKAVQSDSHPWPSNASGDGFYNSYYLDAKTKGTVTATLTWVPTTGQDSTSDPPPSQVIVTESGSASESGGGSGTGQADDGWQDGPSSGGQSGGLSSSGTYYEVKDGSSGTITVGPFTVSASTPDNTTPDASGNFTQMGVMIAAGLSVDKTSVTLTLSGPNAANQALTGQQITASLNGAPANVSSYTWSFTGGTPIKTWDPNGKAADGTPQQLFPLTDADKKGTDTSANHTGIAVGGLSFYDQSADTVTVKCQVNYTLPKDGKGNAKSGSMTLTSKSVTFLKPTATWGIKSGFVRVKSGNLGLYGAPGDAIYKDGQAWHDIAVNVPAPFSGGTFAFAQIITPSVVIHRVLAPGSTATHNYQLPKNEASGLDSVFPYDTDNVANGYSLSQPANTEIDGDSPSADLPTFTNVTDNGGTNWDQSTTSESFTTYLLYKASDPNAIWVPLQSYSWKWSGTWAYQTDQYGGGGWVAMPGSPTTSSTPSATAINSPPSWKLVHSKSEFSAYVPGPDSP